MGAPYLPRSLKSRRTACDGERNKGIAVAIEDKPASRKAPKEARSEPAAFSKEPKQRGTKTKNKKKQRTAEPGTEQVLEVQVS